MIPDLTPREVVRFYSKIRVGGCGWRWTGPVNNHGYGRFEIYRNGKRIRILAHRLVYKLATRKDPGADKIRHGCDNPPCVTPECLVPGTQADNIKDAVMRGRINVSGLSAERDRRDAEALARAASSDEKACSRCRTRKALADFHCNSSTVDGRQYWCKTCVSTYQVERAGA
jgi:hypothetical protein